MIQTFEITNVNSFNQLDLPGYPDYETLRTRLLTAFNEAEVGFGFS